MPNKELPHACIFCERTYPSLERLALHVTFEHPGGRAKIGEKEEKLHVDHRSGDRRMRCLCGQRFTINRIVAAGFYDWAAENRETDSWVAHLRREGGLAAHLQKLRDAAMLDRLERGGKKKTKNPWQDVGDYQPGQWKL